MKWVTSLSIVMLLMFNACSNSPSPASKNLDEAKAKNAVEQFLLHINKPTFNNPKLLSTGPLIIEGDKRTMSFKWSYRYSSDTFTLDGSAQFGFAQDGKWYLTRIMYNGGNGLDSPYSEVK